MLYTDWFPNLVPTYMVQFSTSVIPLLWGKKQSHSPFFSIDNNPMFHGLPCCPQAMHSSGILGLPSCYWAQTYWCNLSFPHMVFRTNFWVYRVFLPFACLESCCRNCSCVLNPGMKGCLLPVQGLFSCTDLLSPSVTGVTTPKYYTSISSLLRTAIDPVPYNSLEEDSLELVSSKPASSTVGCWYCILWYSLALG